MKKIFFLSLFAAGLFQAQTNRFIYEYKFVPDSSKKDSVITEMMALDIDSKGSSYQSLKKIAEDSLVQDQIKKMMSSGNGNISINRRSNNQSVTYNVEKTYPDFKIYLHERISMDSYKILEEEKPVWMIGSETQQIGTYKAQKATTDFGGRSWIAWFTTELPFQDGPYKLYGLPGLIVKLEDLTNSHLITLVANKKIENPAKTDDLMVRNLMPGMNAKELEITEKQFRKLYQDYLTDPSKNMRQMLNNSDPSRKVVVKMKSEDGKEISDPNEMMLLTKKRTEEQEKKNNNRIEPTLYQ